MPDQQPPKPTHAAAEYLKISLFLNGFLTPDALLDIDYPDSLEGDYQDFDPEKREQWYSFTFQRLFGECGTYAADYMGRQLSKAECLFVADKAEAYMRGKGY